MLHRCVATRMNTDCSVLSHITNKKPECMTNVPASPGATLVIRCAGTHQHKHRTEDLLNSAMLEVREFNRTDAAGEEQAIPTFHSHDMVVSSQQ